MRKTKKDLKIKIGIDTSHFESGLFVKMSNLTCHTENVINFDSTADSTGVLVIGILEILRICHKLWKK